MKKHFVGRACTFPYSDASPEDNTTAGAPGTRMLPWTEQLCMPAVEGLWEQEILCQVRTGPMPREEVQHKVLMRGSRALLVPIISLEQQTGRVCQEWQLSFGLRNSRSTKAQRRETSSTLQHVHHQPGTSEPLGVLSYTTRDPHNS